MVNLRSFFLFTFILFSAVFVNAQISAPAPDTTKNAVTTTAIVPKPDSTTTTTAAPAASQDFYAGNWNVLVKGTPNGDPTIPMRFEIKDGKAKGYFMAPEQKTETEMASVEIKGDDLTCSFTIVGYDVTLNLSKKDVDHANGKLMDMFEAEGTRKK